MFSDSFGGVGYSALGLAVQRLSISTAGHMIDTDLAAINPEDLGIREPSTDGTVGLQCHFNVRRFKSPF